MAKFIAMRCKCTRIFYKHTHYPHSPFVTMDINNATKFEDSEKMREKLREEIARWYNNMEVEFISIKE